MKKINIYDSEEVSLSEALKKAKSIINSKTGIVRYLYKSTLYNDEPKFYQYIAKIPKYSFFSIVQTSEEFSGGCSVDKNKAMMKALGEAIERYCMGIYQEENLINAFYNEIKENAVNPNRFIKFSRNQIEKYFKDLADVENKKINWIEGYSITRGKSVLIPAQTVFVPYKYEKNEIMLQQPLSTGGACGTSLAGAIYRGICEVVERDAFMINYLNKLPRKRVTLEKSDNETIKTLLNMFKKYNLDFYLFDFTTDLQIPTFMSLLIDKTGLGPAVHVAAKSDINPETAMIGSIEECQQARPWMRDEMQKKKINRDEIKKHPEKITTFEERGALWEDKEMIPELDFLLENHKTEKVENIPDFSSDSVITNLKTCLNFFKEKNLEVIFVDLTTEDIEELGFKVVKVIIPEMHPLYLTEKFKYLGGERLYNVPKLLGFEQKTEDELNKIPHPFL